MTDPSAGERPATEMWAISKRPDRLRVIGPNTGLVDVVRLADYRGLLQERDELREALEALYGMALNGVVCDPHHKPCNLCAPIFERTRQALSGASQEKKDG